MDTKEQKKLYDQILEVCKQDYVIAMSYPDLFAVLDRVKLSYQLDLLRLKGRIKIIGDKLK